MACVTLTGLLLFAAGADPLPEAAQKELKALQGDWFMHSGERNGEMLEFAKGNRLVLTLRGRKWMFDGQDKGEIVTLDPSFTPKLMDIKSTEKGRPGQVDEAIYELSGDTLRICLYQGKGKQRPTSFASAKGDEDTILIVLKRVKE